MGCLKVLAAIGAVASILLGFVYWPLWVFSIVCLVAVGLPTPSPERRRRRRRRAVRELGDELRLLRNRLRGSRR
jgi:hypothetical protein